MNKTLLLALTCVTLASVAFAPASSAYSVCGGVCVDVTDDGNGSYDIDTCTGNVNVQVGLNNDARFCSD